MLIVTAIVGVLLALAFAGAGGSKLAGVPVMRQSAEHLGLGFGSYRAIGALEIILAIGVLVGLWPATPMNARLGAAAALGLVILMIGAVVYHRKAGDPAGQWTPAAVLALIAAAYVALRLMTA